MERTRIEEKSLLFRKSKGGKRKILVVSDVKAWKEEGFGGNLCYSYGQNRQEEEFVSKPCSLFFHNVGKNKDVVTILPF